MKLMSAVILSLVLGCSGGAANNADNTQGNSEQDGASSGLYGSWQGAFSQTVEDGEEKSVEDSTVKVEFLKPSDEESAARFKISLKSGDQSLVTQGSYTNFESKKLLLSIDKSNFSLLGLADASKVVEFSLVGDALVIKNEEMEMLLTRLKNDSDDENEKEFSTFSRQWLCVDHDRNNSWDITINNDEEFYITVQSPSTSPVTITGEVNVISRQQAELTVIYSQDSSLVGKSFSSVLTASETMKLSLQSASGEFVLNCDGI